MLPSLRKAILLPALVAFSPLQSADPLSVQELAALLRVLSAQAGFAGRIACRDLDMTMQLKKDGLSTDPRSAIAWAANADQARAYRAEGKFVVCSDLALFKEGAALAIVRESGKMGLVLHTANAQGTGVTLSDAILKVAKRV